MHEEVVEGIPMKATNDILHKGGYRFTPQRYLILQVIEEAREHLCIDQILQRVQERNPCVSQTTIYRTLELLRGLGLVRVNHFPDKQPSYEVVEGQAHHHLVCRGCGVILHLDEGLLGTLHKKLQEQYHFHSLTLELLAAGYCDSCSKAVQQDRHSYQGERHDRS